MKIVTFAKIGTKVAQFFVLYYTFEQMVLLEITMNEYTTVYCLPKSRFISDLDTIFYRIIFVEIAASAGSLIIAFVICVEVTQHLQLFFHCKFLVFFPNN